MKKRGREILYDRLHKGGVIVCLGLSLYGSLMVGNFVYKYFTISKPRIKAAKEAAERELLAEGSSEKVLST